MNRSMKHLAPKKHWTLNQYYSTVRGRAAHFFPKSFRTEHFEKILEPYVFPGQSILEIGVAPGLHLIDVAKKFKLNPYGLDYSTEGVLVTKQNFSLAGFNSAQVIKADIFDAATRRLYAGKFDIVYSAGFIEHFDDISRVMGFHRQLVKPGGLLVITLPNLQYMSRFVPPEVLMVHNLAIMNPQALRAALPKGLSPKCIRYYGGIISCGTVYSNNVSVEFARKGLYILQRLILDQFQKVFLAIGISFSPAASAPDLLVIAKKESINEALLLLYGDC